MYSFIIFRYFCFCYHYRFKKLMFFRLDYIQKVEAEVVNAVNINIELSDD